MYINEINNYFYMFSPLEQFNIIPLINLVYYIDLSIVNILIPFASILILVFLTNIYSLKKSTLIPSCFQYYLELLVDFVFVIIKQQIGRDGYVFFPIIFTIFCFILLSNYISLLPAGIALTSHIIVTIFTSFSMCLSIVILGFLRKI